MKSLKNFLIVSRANIQIASLPTATIGIVLAAQRLEDMINLPVFSFILLFFIILTYSCNINCIYDVDVDQKFKKYMSDAVKAISDSWMKRILAIELSLAVTIIIYLVIQKKDIIYIFALFGILCGYAYSAPPLRIKKRGILSPLPVMSGLYFLPIVAGAYVVIGRLSVFIIVFGIGYALIMQGITFINTCEDYDEDKASKIQTIAHVLGVRRTLVLASLCVVIGGIIDLAMLILHKIEWNDPDFFVMFCILLLCLFFMTTIIHISRNLYGYSRDENQKEVCKQKAKNMPKWFLATRYPLLFISLLTL